MNTEGSVPLMNESGGFFGAELATHERIRSVQSQIRIAIQNHHLLFTRAQAFPKDADLENHMKILQDLILSLGRTQLELMYQFKIEMKEKHGVNNLNHVMGMYLGWPDRHEMYLYKPKENGAPSDGDRRAQIMKKKPLLPQSARPKVKMQSLLKVNHNRSILTPKKESERIKGSTKLSESPNSVINSAKKLQSVLKAKNEKISQALDSAKESGDADPKDSLSSGSLKIEDCATSIEDVTQESFLGFFGLIHKDKSKNMVATQKKRKRRSAAGQSNFHGDFSYFQAKRAYTKRAAASSVPESPTSSQDVVDADENDRLSLTSTDKPSEPTSPEIPSSQDLTDVATSQELSADVCSESAEGNSSEKIDGSVKLNPVDGGQAKMADEGNSDCITKQLTLDSDEIKDSMDAETLDKDSTPQVIIGDEKLKGGLSSPNQTEEQENKEELTALQSINQDSGSSEFNMETTEAEILLRYSPETDSVEVIQVKPADTQGIGHKPTSPDKPETLDKSSTRKLDSPKKPASPDESATIKPDSPKKPASPDKSTPGKPVSPVKAASPQKSASPEKPGSPERPATPDKPETPSCDDQSDDSDPTSFMPISESQNPKSSRPSKGSDVCSVCFQSSDAEMEKCSMCGEDFHKECAPNAACPCCQSTSSTISSIVGVNTTSRLTSTDCSEVIKRYLDDSQEDKDDYNRTGARGGYTEPTNNSRDHMEVYDSADCDLSDSNGMVRIDEEEESDLNNFAESEDMSVVSEGRRGAIDVGAADHEEICDSNDDQEVAADSNDSAEFENCENQDGNDRDILLQDDDSLVFPNSSLFEDNSCSNSQL